MSHELGDIPGETLTEFVSHRATKLLFEAWGRAWTEDDAPPAGDDASEIQRLRAAYALPIAQAGLLAVMRLLWVTAPPGSTRDQLIGHLTANIPLLVTPELMMVPAGDFWTSGEMTEVTAEGRKEMN